ncbi:MULTISPECIES: hypothetical protein [unclassified Streptomyces]|uniref:Uncharacterized protein n=1 Tax=Streptomyces sp. NBC_00060 TaxID=2975636 RepID=A0AAU2GV88_9ACTN
MATDEFEGMTLEALNAMLASAKPGELTGAAETLAAAAPDIADIARDLRWYIDQVKWHGAGGDAFREWGRGMVSETLVLAEYAGVVGQEMAHAGQALTEAKAAVPASDGMCYADPEKEKARLKALGPKTNEAINQLNRLSSYYNASKDRISAQPEPKFAPLPAGGGVSEGKTSYGSDGSGAGGTGGGSTGHTSSAVGGTHGYGTTGTTGTTSSPSHTTVASTFTPHEPAGTAIDSVTVTPPPETTTRPTVPTGPTHVQGQTPVLTPPPVLPGPLGKGGLERPTTMPRVPGEGPATGRSTGGLRGPGIARPSGLPGTTRGITPEGITGGRPTPPTGRGSTPRLPMGTVVGEERAGTGMGRGPMGGGMGHGPGGAPRGATGMGGRRLASEPGGTVGAPRASLGGRGEFTPGGTGLVNGNKRGTDRRRSTSSEAPDYLVEDEETWAMDHRKVVPPVVD